MMSDFKKRRALMMSVIKRSILVLILSLIAVTVSPAATTVVVTVTPANTAILAGATQQFSAYISSGIPYFQWSVSCSTSSCGTISQAGLYTAPSSVSAPLAVTVTASALLNYPSAGSTTVTVNPPGPPVISVSVSPQSATVAPSAQQTFNATVNNSSNQSVMWNVSCSAGTCGTISASGVYTAPSAAPSPNSITVTATSFADTTKSGSATVTIGTIGVSISPSTNVQVSAGASQTFAATVTGTSNQSVTWSVSGSGCTGSACGSITSTGVYTAPSTLPSPAFVSVTATSQANTSATATVNVTLTPAVAGFSIAPQGAQVVAGKQQQMTATYNGSPTTNVTWGVSGGGSINSSGLYTAPAASSISSAITVTINASLRSTYGTTASAKLTVVPPVVISIWPSSETVSVNAAQQFIATVTGASNPAVTWSVSGAGCSGASCGTVSSNGNIVTYAGPSQVPNPTAVTLTSALTSNPSQTGTAAITVAPSNNGLLSGQYAFLFRGFDASGSYQAAGTFTADGNGNLTNGVEDINCGAGTMDPQCSAGPVIGQTFSGSYTVNADRRGTFSFNGETFAMALTPTGGKGHFIESDNSGITGSGIFEIQTPSAFTNSAFSGVGYAFGMAGVDATGAPIAEIGGMDLQSSSASTTGVIQGTGLDVNDNGQVSCYPSESRGQFGCGSTGTTRPSGSFNIGSNGRGTASISVPGFGSGTFNFSIYAISSSEFFLFSTDPAGTNPVISGQGLVQQMVTNSFSFFQKGYTAFDWIGAVNGTSNAAVGRLEFDGNGNVIDFAYDENNGGAVTIGAGVGACSKTVGSCTYSLEPNGDVYIRFAPAAATSAILFYPTSPNSGFMLGTGAFLFGKSDAQTITVPPNFAFGTDSMTSAPPTVVSGTGSFNGSNGLVGNEDESSNSGFTGNLLWGGSYSPGSLSGGTATMYLTTPAQQTLIFFAVSYQKTVAIDIDSSVVNPSVLILQQ